MARASDPWILAGYRRTLTYRCLWDEVNFVRVLWNIAWTHSTSMVGNNGARNLTRNKLGIVRPTHLTELVNVMIQCN